MRKGKWLLAAGACGLCIIFYAVTMLPHDRVFSEYKQAFDSLSHPAGTQRVKAYYAFGTLDQTRVMYKADFPQGCDYRVGEVRVYAGTQDSIRAFYGSQRLMVDEQERPVAVMFIPMDPSGRIDSYGLTRDELIQWGPAGFDILEDLRHDQDLGFLKLESQAAYYFVSSGGFSLSNWDVRCVF